ncbi:MAG: ribosome biogenesis factor YjgA [Pseudomonadota bacterium]
MDDEEFGDGTGPDLPSKTALKRQMLALQQLGEALTQLSDKQLKQMPLADDGLLSAIRETRRIRSNSARRRHLQYIGKLMRDVDPLPIERALEQLYQGHRQETSQFHALEDLRDAILNAGESGVDLALQRFPQAERQPIRQLILQHQRETSRGKPPAASRRLFRYLRTLAESETD